MQKSAIPNAITLLNLMAGVAAVLCLIYGRLETAVWLVVLSVFADFIDGAVARALNVHSELGKQLDSLADVVAFGVAPGVMMYGLLAASWQGGAWPGDLFVPALPALLLPAFAALRLGKFNIDERQSNGFIGLPTPACTMLVTGLLLIFLHADFSWKTWIFQPWVLLALTVLLAWLMNAEIPMFALKFKHFGWAGNEIKYIFALVSLALLFALKEAALAVIILTYIALSAALYLRTRIHKP